jgi:hypothetical protein
MLPLFTLTTDRVRLTWSGPPAPDDSTAPDGGLAVSALRSGVTPVVEGGEGIDLPRLRLGEQTAYYVFATSRTGAPVEIRHRDPNVVAGLAPGDGGRVVAGPIDFGGQVGRSRFVVAVDGVEEVAFDVDVFPTKVTFATAEAMRSEIDDTLAGLAFAYLRATSRTATEAFVPPRRATWLTLVRRALEPLEAALDRIAAQPHRDLLRTPTPTRAEQVRHPDATVRRAVGRGRGTGGWSRFRSGVPVRAVVPSRQPHATLDTAEHRWLHARLAVARHTLADLQAIEAVRPLTRRRRRVLADLADSEDRLARLLRLDPLAAAETDTAPPAPTSRLLAAPGYAEAYAACRALDLGLALADGPVPHATKDLWLIYEVWCTLTLARAVADVLGQDIPPDAFFRAEHRGIRFLLRRGQRHAITFERNGQRVRLAYNPRFGDGLVPQQPDLMLTVERDGAVQRFVLDAKYRRDDSTGYVRRYGTYGPPEDALGDRHRYRDAIGDRQGRPRVEEAIAQFPHKVKPEAFTESRLWTSIERIGVGAIPLVPGATDLLDRWLRRVLA